MSFNLKDTFFTGLGRSLTLKVMSALITLYCLITLSTDTHNRECSTIDDFPVVLEASFKPLASSFILAVNDDGTSLEQAPKIPGHMTLKRGYIHSP